MPKALVVDDSTTDRRVVGFLLKKAGGWEIEYALQGKEALEKVGSTEFDLILTDLIMPSMNGLELVAAVGAQRPHVPVILMTSRGNEGIALLALREGAASYIPKRLLPRNLMETVGRVMAVAGRRQAHEPIWGAMRQTECSFLLGSRVAAVQSLVVYLQESLLLAGFCGQVQCTQLGVALQEALLNALYHGNLEVGAHHGAESDAAFHALVARRCQEPPYRERQIHVAATLTEEKAVFVIRDEGSGFDTSQLPDPTDVSALEKASGRGVILMRLFMDQVVYDPAGREVTLVKERKAGTK